jgi:hypothetical protein
MSLICLPNRRISFIFNGGIRAHSSYKGQLDLTSDLNVNMVNFQHEQNCNMG